jgi:hypothetical protein
MPLEVLAAEARDAAGQTGRLLTECRTDGIHPNANWDDMAVGKHRLNLLQTVVPARSGEWLVALSSDRQAR